MFQHYKRFAISLHLYVTYCKTNILMSSVLKNGLHKDCNLELALGTNVFGNYIRLVVLKLSLFDSARKYCLC